MFIDGYSLEFTSTSHKTVILRIYRDEYPKEEFLRFFGVSYISIPFEYSYPMEININNNEIIDFKIPGFVDIINLYSFIGESKIGFICASGMVVENKSFIL